MRLSSAFVLLSALLAMQLSGCASQPANQSEPAAADAADEAGLPDYADKTAISIEWRKQLGVGAGTAYTRLRPVVNGDTVFMADTSGEVYALDLADGSEQWNIVLEQTVTAGVAEDNGQLFVATRDGFLHCLNSTDGREIWRARMTSESVSPAGFDSKRVFIHTVDGRVTAFERADGKQAWSYETAMPVLTVRGTGSPLVLEQLVITGFATGKLVALDKTLGIPRWEVRLATPDGRSELERLVDVDGAPIWDNGVIYAASYHGKLAAVSLNGETRWEEEGSTYTSPELALGNLYLTLDSDHIQSYDMASGAKVWTQKALHGRRLGQTSAYGSWLAVADDEGYLHMLNQVDGELVGRKLLRPKPLHVNYPNQTEGTNWRALRGRDMGIRSPLVATDKGLLVYTNAGELLLLSVQAD